MPFCWIGLATATWLVSLTLLLPGKPLRGQALPTTQGATSHQENTAQSPQGTNLTLHVNSNIVLLDIVVTDHKHQPVHGLTADDFTLVEDGKPQKLDRVEEHVSPAASLQPKPSPHS